MSYFALAIAVMKLITVMVKYVSKYYVSFVLFLTEVIKISIMRVVAYFHHHRYNYSQSAMLNLLLTVLSTLLSSASLVAVLFVISLCYALLGVAFFSSVRTGEAIDH